MMDMESHLKIIKKDSLDNTISNSDSAIASTSTTAIS